MSDVKRALAALYEQRRNAMRGYEREKSAGNRIGMQREKRKVREIDADIRNLEAK